MTETCLTLQNIGLRGDTKFRAAKAQGGDIRVFKYVSSSISAGATASLNLSTAWNWNYALIHQIIVAASASTDFDVYLFPDDSFTVNNHYYWNSENNRVMNDAPGLFYVDMDEERELHLRIVNTDSVNASTFTVYILVSPISPA